MGLGLFLADFELVLLFNCDLRIQKDILIPCCIRKLKIYRLLFLCQLYGGAGAGHHEHAVVGAQDFVVHLHSDDGVCPKGSSS